MRHPISHSPADYRASQNGWGHPGWERPVQEQEPQEPIYDEDSAIVVAPEPGKYRVSWDVGTNRFTLIPVELPF
jgi:hypothetical protein